MRKKILGVLIFSCLISACFLFAFGCGEEKAELILSDYAMSVEQAENGSVEFTADGVKAVAMNGTYYSTLTTTYDTVYSVRDVSTDERSLYNATLDKQIGGSYDEVALYQYNSYNYTQKIIELTSVSEGIETSRLMALDGTMLTSEYNMIDSRSYSGETYTVTYSTLEGDSETVNMYLGSDGYYDSTIMESKKVSTNDTISSSGYYDTFNTWNVQLMGSSNKGAYAETDATMNNYKFTYVLVNNGYEIRMKNGVIFSLPSNTYYTVYADGKLVYVVNDPVEYDAENGYNFYYAENSNYAYKLYQSVYSVDLNTGETTELKLDYAINDIDPIYNYTNKCYDAFEVEAVKKDGDIAIIADEQADICNLITDKNGLIGYDFGNNYYNISNMFKLNDNGNVCAVDSRSNVCILDKNGAIVTTVGTTSNVKYNETTKEFVCTSNGKTYTVNTEGKVNDILDFSSVTFSGDAAVAYVNSEPYIISSKYPGGVKFEEAYVNDAENNTYYYLVNDNLISKIVNSNTVTIYDLNGNALYECSSYDELNSDTIRIIDNENNKVVFIG